MSYQNRTFFHVLAHCALKRYRKTKINVYVVGFLPVDANGGVAVVISSIAELQIFREIEFSTFSTFLRERRSAALCGSPAHAIVRTSSHTRTCRHRPVNTHIFVATIQQLEQADLSFHTPKSAPAYLRSACTHTKCGFPQQQVRELFEIDETFFFQTPVRGRDFRSISALKFLLLFEKILKSYSYTRGKK